ncbi:hypothetical protein [Microvirga antarctica]|uniref:hypothetical protein n=1 Tax=Microvirga antarctica TaxID=2819233 RepID=UPI001B30A98F|nr:hypothetical protein [Microvirga antarctica]
MPRLAFPPRAVRARLHLWALSSTLAATAVLILGSVAAQAAHGGSGRAEPGRPVPSTQMAVQETPASVPAAVDDGKSCGQSRKRLFVEGEGWIVRRVTTCY